MTNTKTLTANEATLMLANAYPYAEADSMEADALALAALASGPQAAQLYALALTAYSSNTLAMRAFFIEYAQANGLSLGRWRSMADHLAKALTEHSSPIDPADLARPMADFGPYAYLQAKNTISRLANAAFGKAAFRSFSFEAFYRARLAEYPAGSIGRYVAELVVSEIELDHSEHAEYSRLGI